jgi:protein involved in polysaccharide export with SLBB domain
MIKVLRILPLLLLSGCALPFGTYSSGAPVPGPSAGPDGAITADQALADYHLGPGDQLRVTVFDEPDLSGDFTVSTQGTLSIPLVGDLPAAGKTGPEFAAALEERLRKGLVKEPRVSTQILLYRPFYILGEVGKPGTYPYPGAMTVLNAIATGGGFSYRADTRHVYIKRANEQKEHWVPIRSDTIVLPGDTLRVGQRLF